jgi:hypothetical protein
MLLREAHPLLRFHRSGQPLEGADARQSNREKPFANVQSPDSPQAQIHDRNFKSFTVEKSVKLSGGRREEQTVTGRPRWCLLERKISDDVCDKRSSEQPVGKLACDEMRQSTMSLTLRIDRVCLDP